MGQIVKRKKGRPPKVDLSARELPPPSPPERDLRRSLRRRNVKYVFDLDDYFDEDELFDDENDEDQHRREKKLELLLKLQTGKNEAEPVALQESRCRRVDHAPYTSASSSESDEKSSKKQKIDGYTNEDSDDGNGGANEKDNYNEEDEEEVRERKPDPKAEESAPGTLGEEAPPEVLLLDKKALEVILDKLQKKDIYGVYAEPVDPEELPDYHDIIEHPMDFATVRNKLGNGSYATFEQFESDVFLICSNAMKYNAPDTIYYKQARTIQELAKRKFEDIKLNMEHTEKDITSEQKMRSGSILKKQIQRSISRTVQEPVGSDFSSGATLATGGDNPDVSNALQAIGPEKPGSIDGHVEGNTSLNDDSLDKAEESLPGNGPLYRFGRKGFVNDENRRATYTITLSHTVVSPDSIFSTFGEETKQLVPVGLYSDHSYARSLARFAATLGTVAWEVASKRIEHALPQGFRFGQGWVGEYEPLPTPLLMLENCSVEEPPFLAKVQPSAKPRKLENHPTKPVTESPTNVPLLEHTLSFLGPAPPIRGNNIPERKASFFLSPGVNTNSSRSLTYQHQNLQSRGFVEADKNPVEHVELSGPPSVNKSLADHDHPPNMRVSRSSEIEPYRPVEFTPRTIKDSPYESFKQSDNNGIVFQRLPGRKIVGNKIGGHTIVSSPNLGQGLSDPVQLDGQSFVNQNSADPTHNMRVCRSSEVEPSRSIEFSPRNIKTTPSGSFQQSDSNGVAFQRLSDRKIVGNKLDGHTVVSLPNRGQGLSGPVQLNGPSFVDQNSADHAPNKRISRDSEIEPSRSMEFSPRNIKSLPSGSFNQSDSNGVAFRRLPNGDVVGNRVDGHTPVSSPNQGEGQGLSDPVQYNGPSSANQNSADHAPSRRISRSSEIEPSTSTEFSPRNIKISPSGPFKQPNSHGFAFQGLPDGKIVGNKIDGYTIVSLPNQGQGLSDPVQLNGPSSVNKHLADHAPNRRVSRSSEIEPSRSMERHVKFSPSGSYLQSDSNGVMSRRMPGGKIVGSKMDGHTIVGSPNQGQGLCDQVQLMRQMSEIAHNQQKPSQIFPSSPNFDGHDSNNAALAAARAWMSVGAGGFRPLAENGNKNQIYADSLFNSTRDMHMQSQLSRFHGQIHSSALQNVQMDRNVSSVRGFVPQGQVAMMVEGNPLMQFQNQGTVYPQVANGDLSRLQLQSTWRNISPQMQSRQKQESFPPDLNIGFQSSGSPGRPSSSVLVDPQQPDLALQL
ncbi:hypothetical protein OROGR_007238 [Orobanche gracilis]